MALVNFSLLADYLSVKLISEKLIQKTKIITKNYKNLIFKNTFTSYLYNNKRKFLYIKPKNIYCNLGQNNSNLLANYLYARL